MAQITGKQVYDALMKDRRFSADPIFEELNALIYSMPDIFKEMLDKQVTLPLLFEARIIFTQKYIEGGYLKKYVDLLPTDHAIFLIFGSKEEIVQKGQDKLSASLLHLREYAKKVLQASKATQDLVFEGITGLKPSVLKKYKEGSLTFAELLTTQPALIVYV